jgi:hypothetical protein
MYSKTQLATFLWLYRVANISWDEFTMMPDDIVDSFVELMRELGG